MTRLDQQPISPQEIAARIRCKQWELEAEKLRDRRWWNTPRFDILDMFLLCVGIPSLFMTLLAIFG